jgi:chorismate synthase
MMRIGRRFRVELFGTSHGAEVGATIEGVPAGTPVEIERIQAYLDRRRPVGRRLATRRHEEDRLVIDSGVVDGRADGTALRAHVANVDVRRSDYDPLREVPRPGHADYPARVRYGPDADLSGGGIFSGRMTVGIVIAGALAARLLAARGIEVASYTVRIADVGVDPSEATPLEELRRAAAENEVGCPDASAARAMEERIASARRDGDSVGGVIETRATGLPVGWGEPFFDPVESVLAHLLFAIPAVKGVEFGAGFEAARMRGSEHNDPFCLVDGKVRTRTNRAGGILGGLTTGMPVVHRVVIKPTSSIAREQATVDLARGVPTTVRVPGRHDPCIVPRAGVVVEAATAIGLADLGLVGGFLP